MYCLIVAIVCAGTAFAQQDGSYYYQEKRPSAYGWDSNASTELRKQGMRTRPQIENPYKLPETNLQAIEVCRLQVMRAETHPSYYRLHAYILATYEADMDEWVYQTPAFACNDQQTEDFYRAKLKEDGYPEFFKVVLSGYFTWR